MLLTELLPGQRATIKNMNQLSPSLRHKLMIMGVLPKSEIIYLRSAPLGDPLQIQSQGINLSINKNLAQQIEVEVI